MTGIDPFDDSWMTQSKYGLTDLDTDRTAVFSVF